MVSLIERSLVSVERADEIKDLWEQKHRFKLPFKSFRERFDGTDLHPTPRPPACIPRSERSDGPRTVGDAVRSADGSMRAHRLTL